MNKHTFSSLFTFVAVIIMVSCKKTDTGVTPAPPVASDTIFTITPASLNLAGAGDSKTLKVTMNGSNWTVYSDQSWCTASILNSSKATDSVIISAAANATGAIRIANLTFVMDQKKLITVQVTQAIKPITYPDYSNPIAADATGMSSKAKALAHNMFAGYNLGNTMEAPGGETGWGNPLITQLLIDSIKAAGINTIRIPCAWNYHVTDASTCLIDPAWLARVKDVVNYCYKDNMYVVLNAHWDGGWRDENPYYAKQDAINAKQKAIWQQIAVYFRDFDEHLLFAGTNEVGTSTTATTENFNVQMSFNQTFVDAVRSTGGKNAYRDLVIQAYSTNIDLAVNNLKVSTDKVADRLFVEVHYYAPPDFCILTADASWATKKYFWGTNFAQYGPTSGWGQEDYVQSEFLLMKTNFVDKGYPVIMGEYGAAKATNLTGSMLQHHLDSRAYYYQYVAQQAKPNGMVPFVWDTGSIFDRTTGATIDKQTLNAYISGATAGVYPF